MKKAIFGAFLIISVIGSINAEEEIEFSLQIANFGAGSSYSRQQTYSEVSIEICNLFFENYVKNMGFKISPLSIRTIDMDEINFINVCAYFNLLNHEHFIFGPFGSLQYLSIINWQKFDPKNITINLGLKFIIKYDYYNFIGKNFISEIEAGYRYNFYNGHQFYYLTRLDLVATLVFIGKIGQFFNP